MGSMLLSGCGALPFGEGLTCTSSAGHDTTISIIKEEVEKRVAQYDESLGARLSRSKIRAALHEIGFSIADVRTSKEDPNSTKKFCVGKLKMVFPAQMVSDAEETRRLQDLNNLTEFADNSGAERSANAFTLDIDFNVQPTDDGGKVYAELEDADTPVNLVGAVLAGHLARKDVENSHKQAEAEAAAAAQQEQESLDAQKRANLDEAKAQNNLSMQVINESWSAIPGEQRDRLLELQRAWIRKKTADCKVEAAQVSTDPTEREASRLRCEARMNNERASQLRQLAYEGE